MENVMLTSKHDMIKIVDFGLSNVYTSENPLHTHCGSPEYAAPELFIEGKHYGPEVDLWSLGVILYGMVVGQLPFVSSTRETGATSHQARRKKLLEQINKGLATPHRKALALLSSEFKAMMAKLLIADANKRIRITELIFHPWITEKGRKSIRSNPLKRFDEYTQTTFIKEVAQMIHVDWVEVQHAIKADPHGNIAGMYNIVSYKRHEKSEMNQLRCGSPEPQTHRPKIAIASEEHLLRPKSPIKRAMQLKSAPLNKVPKIVTAATPRRLEHTIVNRKLMIDRSMGEDTTNIIRTQYLRHNKDERESRKRENFIVPLRPRAKQQINCIHNIMSPLPIALVAPTQSPTVKLKNTIISQRSKYQKHSSDSIHSSDSVASITILPATPRVFVNLKITPKGDAPYNAGSLQICKQTENYDDLLHTMTVPSQNTRSKLLPTSSKETGPVEQHKQTKTTSRTQSATLSREHTATKQQRCTTPVNNRRPLTTGPTHTAERAAIKRRSMLPVLTNKRTPVKNGICTRPGIATTNMQGWKKEARQVVFMKPAVAAASAQVHIKPKLTPRDSFVYKKSSPIDKDQQKKYLSSPVRSSQQHQNIEFCNEPIARSIAGYVSKNISSKLQTIYKPSLLYFHKMQFLSDNLQIRKSKSSFDVTLIVMTSQVGNELEEAVYNDLMIFSPTTKNSSSQVSGQLSPHDERPSTSSPPLKRVRKRHVDPQQVTAF